MKNIRYIQIQTEGPSYTIDFVGQTIRCSDDSPWTIRDMLKINAVIELFKEDATG